MKIYIAGKITGEPNYKQLFGQAAENYRSGGHIVLNPAELPAGLDYAEYMKICFAMIDVCDAVCFLPNWGDSKGAKLEYAYACGLGKRIMFDGGVGNVARP